jgi:hypothetical protein
MSGHKEGKYRTPVTAGAASYVSSNIDAIAEIVDLDEPFTVKDVDLESRAATAMLRQLTKHGVLEVAGRQYRRPSNQTNFIKEYEFTDSEVREFATESVNNRNTLPCGHTAHILNKGDHYGCKYCDEQREYSKETVREAL